MVSNAEAVKIAADNKRFAKIMMWVLKHNKVSVNALVKPFKMNWNTANGFIERLHNLRIIGDIDGNFRNVIPNKFEDLPPDIVKFLENYYSLEDVKTAFEIRKNIKVS
jgi:hypothetical protein